MGDQQNPDGIYVPPGITSRYPLDWPSPAVTITRACLLEEGFSAVTPPPLTVHVATLTAQPSLVVGDHQAIPQRWAGERDVDHQMMPSSAFGGGGIWAVGALRWCESIRMRMYPRAAHERRFSSVSSSSKRSILSPSES